MESWVHGCPIVATNSQGPGEVITDGLSGLITPVDDVRALTAAIRSVLESDDLRRSLIEGASQVYAENGDGEGGAWFSDFLNRFEPVTKDAP
jgi:glycosyltransferase involved in cell wall biosynthesis